MDTSRTINMVLSMLQYEILGKQDKLERTINSDMELESKSARIFDLLKELVLHEQALIKFQSLIEANNKV